ncbi:MAG TPA: TIGR02453 family protein [Candidatus Angelobacter sp.]|jgi:uncharacterized protein (TIGR02453 family)|nr:TIGR02453 family protein [Candidatus Angelobacter sp.]
MAYFRPEGFAFLRQLKRNNKREWFARNKAHYDEYLVEPALSFVRDFAPHLEKISPHFEADARPSRGSLFRIYRDTRFSTDKKPYKTHVGIHFSHASGKDAHAPVFYLHLEPEGCFVAAGIWHPDGRALTMMRTAIVQEPAKWAAVRKKLPIEGASLSRPPKGFDRNHRFIDDLKMKDFVSSVALTEAQLCSDKLMREFVSTCKKMAPLVGFTCSALRLKF